MQYLLILNSGSSSLKFSIFQTGGNQLDLLLSGNLSGIRADTGHFSLRSKAYGQIEEAVNLSDHEHATTVLFNWLNESFREKIDVVGHRIVHGGRQYVEPQVIENGTIADLRKLEKFAPLHLPPAIAALDCARKNFSEVPHVACFDTSFHRTMPERARMLPFSKELFFDDGVEKFGFHGLSYEYVVSELRDSLKLSVERMKIVIAHLGNGCSMAAIENGRSIETTMGFSPTGGMLMGTRCGDIDPGLVEYFSSEKGLSAGEFVKLANNRSGLLGLSGVTSDMQKLLSEEGKNEDCLRAVEIFCYHARKHIGALAAALGGIDLLVFTGGIGENSVVIRERICSGLNHLGLSLSNQDKVRVVRTNEELMIARHCMKLLQG